MKQLYFPKLKYSNFPKHTKYLSVNLIILVLSIFSTTLISQVNLEEGLRYHFDFNNGLEENHNNTTLNIRGDIQLSQDTPCGNGLSADLSGVDSYIEILGSNTFNPENNFSISLFVKIPEDQPTQTTGANSILSKWILANGDHDRQGYPFALRIFNSLSLDNGELVFIKTEGLNPGCNSSARTGNSPTLNDNQFHHILIGNDNKTLKLFLDCELISEVEDNLVCTSSNEANILIGARNETFHFNRPNNFKGIIDDLRFYDRFVSTDEIERLCDCNCIDESTLSIEYQGLDVNGNCGVILESQFRDSNNNGLTPSTGYTWLPSGETSSTIVVTEPGTYSVSVINSCQKEINTEIIITENDLAQHSPSIEILNQEMDGCTLTLQASTTLGEVNDTPIQITDSQWNGPDGFFTTENPIIVNTSGSYTFTVTDECGNTTSSSFEVTTVDKLTFPNIFFPDSSNQGGINNTFGPESECDQISNYTLQIYNRWGELVFETSNTDERWPGRTMSQGDILEEDVYLWQCSYVSNSRLQTQKGSITLKRN